MNVEDGNYLLTLNDEGLTVGYNKKFAKEHKLDTNVSANSVVAKAYDEELLSKSKNCIYVQIDGFDDYVTTVVDNTFSVYKMDTFNLNITEKDFTLKKIK